MTASDIVSAAGLADGLGDSSKTKFIEKKTVEAAQAKIKSMMEVTIDSMKTSTADIAVYLVGGGSVLAPDSLAGVSRVVRFKNYGVANACGAAIAQVSLCWCTLGLKLIACRQISGILDVVKDISVTPASQVLAEIEQAAIAKAVAAGASETTVKIVEAESIPVAYTPGKCRFYVKAAGEWVGSNSDATNGLFLEEDEEEDEAPRERMKIVVADPVPTAKELLSYRPSVKDKVWTLSELDLKWIQTGCYVMGKLILIHTYFC